MSVDKFDIHEVRRVVLAAYDQGLCPVPPRPDGSKAPIGDWGRYQRVRPTRQQVEAWYGGHTGVGLVCGEISGNLECLEFDDPRVYEGYKELAQALGLGDLVKRIEVGYLEQWPSGGVHWLYRCTEISGNSKLAGQPDGDRSAKVLIETRGEGGYVIISPSFGRVHPSGKPYVLLGGGVNTIAAVTPEERKSLFELVRTFDLMPKARVDESPNHPANTPKSRPGDDFNARADWGYILDSHGWRLAYEKNGVGYWRRPGKQSGVSATTNWQGSDLLYVFSTSTAFQAQRGYSKFTAYSLLQHNSDHAAAAGEVARMGYGQLQRSDQELEVTTTERKPGCPLAPSQIYWPRSPKRPPGSGTRLYPQAAYLFWPPNPSSASLHWPAIWP
jgi:putative DNA primase/helicase